MPTNGSAYKENNQFQFPFSIMEKRHFQRKTAGPLNLVDDKRVLLLFFMSNCLQAQ